MKKLRINTVWTDGFKNDYEIVNPRKGKIEVEAARLQSFKKIVDWKISKGNKIIVEKGNYKVNEEYSQ